MSEVNNNTPQSIDDGIPEVTFDVEVHDVVQAPVDATLSIHGMAADAYETGVAIEEAKTELQTEVDTLETSLSQVFGLIFPVGSVYVSTSDTAPTFGGSNWNWQEIKVPVTQGDLINGYRGFAAFESGDDPGENHLHFWLRIEDTEVSA